VKDPARLFGVIAGVKRIGDVQAVFGPLFDLVEIAIVGDESIISFLAGPIVTHASPQGFPVSL
jgi:hypothetical protein